MYASRWPLPPSPVLCKRLLGHFSLCGRAPARATAAHAGAGGWRADGPVRCRGQTGPRAGFGPHSIGGLAVRHSPARGSPLTRSRRGLRPDQMAGEGEPRVLNVNVGVLGHVDRCAGSRTVPKPSRARAGLARRLHSQQAAATAQRTRPPAPLPTRAPPVPRSGKTSLGERRVRPQPPCGAWLPQPTPPPNPPPALRPRRPPAPTARTDPPPPPAPPRSRGAVVDAVDGGARQAPPEPRARHHPRPGVLVLLRAAAAPPGAPAL
jgi:hypothetical protein